MGWSSPIWQFLHIKHYLSGTTLLFCGFRFNRPFIELSFLTSGTIRLLGVIYFHPSIYGL